MSALGGSVGVADGRPGQRGRPAVPAFGRKWDLLLIIVFLFAFAAVGHITHMLLIGDWDFWADWKDRQWWPLLTPTVGIIVPAAAQYVLWRLVGIPGGATAATLLLVLSQWLSRELSFHEFVYFPLAFVAPATMLPLGILLDVLLILTRSFVLTSIAGGLLWGILFQPANLPLFAAFWQPVLHHGDSVTVADVMGFEYVRSQAPAYLRIVEEGHLRSFISEASYVTAVTAGMASIAGCWVGYLLARFVAFAPARVFLPTRSVLRFLHPGQPEKPPDRATDTAPAGGGT